MLPNEIKFILNIRVFIYKPDSIPSSRSLSSPKSIFFTSGEDKLVILFVPSKGTSADGGSNPILRTHFPFSIATSEMLFFNIASLPISTGELV